MDLIKIGQFLSELRKEQGLTQEKLGEKIGVTNKTISRWETGKYLPPAEILLELSDLYSITINELLAGKRLSATEYKEEAEKNLFEVTKNSAFSLKDKINYFTNKWLREHLIELIIESIIMISIIVAGFILNNGLQIIGIVGLFVGYIVQRNRMMIFVERFAYGNHK